MPEVTPIYGFPYPCPGENVDDAAFANLANAIDTKLLDVQGDEFQALNRFSQSLTTASNSLAAGVDTVLVGANSTYTFPSAGVWFVDARGLQQNLVGTITSFRIRVRTNAVVRFGFRLNTEFGVPQITQTMGMVVVGSGDTLSFQCLYTGTGTMDVVNFWSAHMIVRTP